MMKSILGVKKHIHLMIFSISITLITACNQKIEITYYEHLGSFDTIVEMMEKYGCAEYDSIVFSDGSYAVGQYKIAPSNCLVRYIDQNGKVIATISNASERYAQRLVFRYDENGRLKYLLRFDENMEPTFHEGSDSVYLNFRLAIDSINFQCPDLRRHTLTEIIYGNDGIACGIIEQPSGKSIKAPDNYKLEVSVEQCLGFWESDLNGGCYILKTSIVPMSNLKEYSIKQFEDFSLVTESHYKEGILQASYSNE